MTNNTVTVGVTPGQWPNLSKLGTSDYLLLSVRADVFTSARRTPIDITSESRHEDSDFVGR